MWVVYSPSFFKSPTKVVKSSYFLKPPYCDSVRFGCSYQVMKQNKVKRISVALP